MAENPQNPSESYENRLCQIPLKRLVFYILGNTLDKSPVEPIDGLMLAAMDHEERLIHIQFDSLETGQKLEKPICWRKKDWVSEYAKWCQDKKFSELRRSAATKQSQNINIVANHLRKKFHLDEKSAKDTAIKMVLDGDPTFITDILKLEQQEKTADEKAALGRVTYLPTARRII